jgi:hypothetical protein
MFVEFEEMPGDARIWIYQADREFTENETESITKECMKFLDQWAAHGSGLRSSFEISYNRFLIISIDEKQAMASGCSIDSCVHFVQSLGNALGVDFFSRTNMAFLKNGEVIIEDLSGIKTNQTLNHISAETLTFNNLIQVKSDLESKWIIPVSESWMNKYFKTQKV